MFAHAHIYDVNLPSHPNDVRIWQSRHEKHRFARVYIYGTKEVWFPNSKTPLEVGFLQEVFIKSKIQIDQSEILLKLH